MRVLATIVGIAVLSCAGSANARATLQGEAKASLKKGVAARNWPVFAFMNQDTETVYTTSPVRSNCLVDAVGKTQCTNFDDPIVAGKKMKWLSMLYFKGRLYSVVASANNSAFADLLSAFVAKYGPPSKSIVEKWQSQGGAIFDDNVVIWYFKGGRLRLSEMGLDIESCSFGFTSNLNAPPPDAPKVDF